MPWVATEGVTPMQNLFQCDKTYLQARLTIYASETLMGPPEVEETPQSGLTRRQDVVKGP